MRYIIYIPKNFPCDLEKSLSNRGNVYESKGSQKGEDTKGKKGGIKPVKKKDCD